MRYILSLVLLLQTLPLLTLDAAPTANNTIFAISMGCDNAELAKPKPQQTTGCCSMAEEMVSQTTFDCGTKTIDQCCCSITNHNNSNQPTTPTTPAIPVENGEGLVRPLLIALAYRPGGQEIKSADESKHNIHHFGVGNNAWTRTADRWSASTHEHQTTLCIWQT